MEMGGGVKAMVVDECDSTMGCDADHDYQPPCPNQIADASKAVWKALGVSENNWGDLDAQTCKLSGGIRGKKLPAGQCNHENDSDCCVQVSTGWYKGRDRCHKYITINGNGRRVKAMVVDECDSTMGCDDEHDYQPPCPNNIVDASKEVWKPLGVSENNWGDLNITWSE
ncbi:putative ripening-related protein 5 [Tanacetum coccineum]